jgi:precorrin-6x reductase
MRYSLTLILLILLAVDAAAQSLPERPLRGASWDPPPDPSAAAEELLDMRAFGIEAIRMPFIDDETILSTADRGGLMLFLDLPVANMPAPLLRDTLAFAEQRMRALLALAARHPSIYAVGLARGVDTSEPRACAYFERLAEQARAAGLLTYYRTRFIERDRCAGAVDLVLLDARDRRPERLLARWRRRALLTVGHRELKAFTELEGVPLLVRSIERPAALPTPDALWLFGRGPFALADELALLREHRVEVLVTKASGGDATYPKIEAARLLGLPVVMIRRPLPPAGEVAADVDEALAWIAARLAAAALSPAARSPPRW